MRMVKATWRAASRKGCNRVSLRRGKGKEGNGAVRD